jgi:signal transduction histidine kinase
MTRRIATAILLTVWAVLIAGGFTAYWATRSVLVADLDAVLTARAMALAESSGDGAATAPAAARDERYVIQNEHGQTIHFSADPPEAALVPPPQKASFSRLADGRLLRTVTVQHRVGGGADGTVTVVYSNVAGQVDRVLERLALTLAVCGVVAGAAAAAVAVGVARAALRPLHDASHVVGEIDEGRLDRRIDAASLPTELRPVAERLNGMLGRLEGAFGRRKQFLADASHELRTPVAALITTIEVALRRRRDAEELTATLETCLTDARYLKRLVNVLLEHARGEASAASPARDAQVVDAAELLAECADVVGPLAEVRGIRLGRSIGGPLGTVTRPQQVRSVVTNLLSNAIDYNRPGGTVELSARVDGGALVIVVRDTGQGISPEHLPHLFEPFYRVDGVRRGGDAGSESPHLGLGLFLVDSHVKSLGGRCTVESAPGVGTTMTVTLPAEGGQGRSGLPTRTPGPVTSPAMPDCRKPSTIPTVRR